MSEHQTDPPPNTNEIVGFVNCASCTPDCPPTTSRSDWQQLEIGMTKWGLQVWCKRCDANVLHVDFQGRQLSGNTTRRAP
jgi:hypothetical protein